MKIIAKISVFIFLLCQLTTSFANNPTTNIEPENDHYVAVWFVQEGDVMIEMAQMDIDTKYLNKEGSTLDEKVDMEVIKELLNIKEISERKGLKGKKALITVLNYQSGCSAEDLEFYCFEEGPLVADGQCVGVDVFIEGFCIVVDPSLPCFGWGTACTSFNL